MNLEHYIISSGIEEMIHGCSIAGRFRRVYASKFIYRDEIVAWPGVAINYTTKTQYLFRINKGIESHWDNGAINQFMAEDDRPIPFARMIFVGDGTTDIPAMKMTTHQGGCAIAVYDPDRGESDLSKIHQLIAEVLTPGRRGRSGMTRHRVERHHAVVRVTGCSRPHAGASGTPLLRRRA